MWNRALVFKDDDGNKDSGSGGSWVRSWDSAMSPNLVTMN